MKIKLPVAHSKVLEFESLADLANHYSALSNAMLTESQRQRTIKDARFSEGKAHAYASVAWQIGRITIEE